MLFCNKNNWIAAAAATVMLLGVPLASARDDWDGWKAPRPIAPVPAARPARFVLEDIEPADGGRTLLAAVPKVVETPTVSAPISTGKRLGAFASVAISAGKLPFARKWRGVTGTDYAALFMDGCAGTALRGCDSALAGRLRKARDAAARASGREVLEIVNDAVNTALTYGTDRAIWGRGDYWATPAETMARGVGDCEDFAITKLWLLRSLGFAPESLQLVVLQETRRSIYHAVLAVHIDGERLILDNLSASVRPDSAYPSYFPIMSFVADKSYIHGFEGQRSSVAGMPADLSSVSPGEGV